MFGATFFKSILPLVLVVGMSACSSAPPVSDAAVVEAETGESLANRAAREAEATYFVDVEFQKGSNQLTEQSRAAISSLLNRARAEGQVEDVKVLAWSDEEFPSSSRKKLSENQRKLADLRTRAIENHIHALKYGIQVELHNMAKRPSTVARWFNTADARFKRSLLAAGLPTTSDAGTTQALASHAVVLVVLK